MGMLKDCLKELPSRIKMPYVSIDLETTGLNPDYCQLLEIGAVYDDGFKFVDELSVFHKYVYSPNGRYTGEPFALQMNAKILKRLSSISGADKQNKVCVRPDEVAECFRQWLIEACGWDGKTCLTPAGKNFASFDKQFLDRLPGWTEKVKLNHRTLDPAMLWWNPLTDDRLPGSQECMDRAGLKGTVAHTAVEDAEVVVRLIRLAIRQGRVK
jgi:DNA polymerase III epsilon subunit-like protein